MGSHSSFERGHRARRRLLPAVAALLLSVVPAWQAAAQMPANDAKAGSGGALKDDVTTADSAAAQSLTDVLALTYETNPTLEAQRASLRSTDEGLSQALSNWRPTITINGSVGASETLTDPPGLSSTRTDAVNESVDLTVSQPLFRGFRTLNQTARARADIDAARASLVNVEQSVLLAAVDAYTAVVRDAAVVALNRNNVRVLERQLDAARNRFDVGELTRTDVAQAESRLANAVASQISAEGDLISSRAVFEEVVGIPPGDLRAVSGPEHLMPDGLESAVAAARANNPVLVATRFLEVSARENVQVIQGELLPSLSLNGALRESNQSSGPDSETTSGSVTANLRVPLYQSGAVYSRVRQARHVASQRLLQVAESERQVVRTATQSWEGLETARAQIEAFASEVETQEIALEGVIQESLVGARTVLDELDAEQELFNAQVNLVRAQRDEVIAAYQLLAAMGRLTAAHLDLPVAIYDPGENLRRVDFIPFNAGSGR